VCFQRVAGPLTRNIPLQGWGYQKIDGCVTSASRQTRIYQFDNPESKQFVFLLSTWTGGLGINLATADTGQIS
jgi:chromodomain-helicase-DNA-binding protein 1